ncbi:MAG: DUF1343 domain-containing protein [Alphaproteobacteria bacterium]|nr:DUF1343 domain-containing protein [Alphaproteobacteria bacterium]
MMLQLPRLGIDSLLEDKETLKYLSSQKVGMITHQNALTQTYQVSAYALKKKIGSALTCIFSPEHGWSGQVAEGRKVANGFDPHLNVPVFSLYGTSPLKEVEIDILIIDLQDVGLRCYTYGATCAQFLEKHPSLEVIVCDRPNPLGARQKGPPLGLAFRSLVGYFDVPFQHGKTLGELLLNHNQNHAIRILPCQHDHQPYHYPWVPPSPNLPTWEAALLYPALVLLEGTNISEGRGTSFPFTCLGAPGLDQENLLRFLKTYKGIQARPLTFTPQSGKWKGEVCTGVHLLLTDYSHLEAFDLGLELVAFLKSTYASFKWVKGEKQNYFIDLLLGSDRFRKDLENSPLSFEEIPLT